MPEIIAGQFWAAGAPAATANTDLPAQVDSHGYLIVSGSASATPIPVTLSEPVGGGITWGAPTAVAMTGASKTLIAANAARKALMIINPVGNAQVSYDLSGGTVTLVGGIPLLAGAVDTYTGADCPVGAVTIIGTNAQNALYVEGT